MRAVVILAVALAWLAGSGAADAEGARPVTLSVKPLLCVTDRLTPACQMSFVVRWSSIGAGNYCVSNDLQTAPLRCWDGASLGEYAERREVRDEFSYWINTRDSAERLAAVRIEVLRLDDGDRKRRRRSRHVWDIL
jgi:hypothetical protein